MITEGEPIMAGQQTLLATMANIDRVMARRDGARREKNRGWEDGVRPKLLDFASRFLHLCLLWHADVGKFRFLAGIPPPSVSPSWL